MDQLILNQVAEKWDTMRIRSQKRLLRDTQVLLCGYGAIGKRIAQLLQPFDCKLDIFNRSGTERTLKTIEEMKSVLGEADIVICSFPDTPQTRDLFDAELFGLMKDSGLFVNVGRGSLVVEEDLMQAIRENKLGGAVLEVTKQKPLPPGHPLWKFPRVILMQHTGGGSNREFERMIDFFGENLTRYRVSQPLKNPIDWKRGY